jgi:hypothetical protein
VINGGVDMAIVIVAMVAIVLTAGGVLGAVYATHVITESPQARAKLRRQSFAAVERIYAVRRQVGYRVRRATTAAEQTAPVARETGIRTVAEPAPGPAAIDRAWPVAQAALRRIKSTARRAAAMARHRVAAGHGPAADRPVGDYLATSRLPARPAPPR